MMTPPSIIFIIPYFGRWPFWMPFFIESCRANASVNWLLISDCAPLESLPPNVKQRSMDFSIYCSFVSARLGFEFAPATPYKLCDIKPALGYIHEEDVVGFDFWAFSDIDVIYGNLREYFTCEKLRRYKLFSTHERRISGHLCLLRNEPELRALFWKIPNVVERIQDQRHHALDEGAFTRLFLWRKNFPDFLFRLIGRFNRWRRVAEFREAFSTPNGRRPWTDGTQHYPEFWFWRGGRLFNSKDGEREFPYLHFLVWKKAWNAGDSEMSPVQGTALAKRESWCISKDGFSEGAVE